MKKTNAPTRTHSLGWNIVHTAQTQFEQQLKRGNESWQSKKYVVSKKKKEKKDTSRKVGGIISSSQLVVGSKGAPRGTY
jgi:hypothetical protein